jgi:hypothetical protein
MGEMRNAYKILVGKPEGMGPVGRPKHRREDNIGMILREIGRKFEGWMHLTQDLDQWPELL